MGIKILHLADLHIGYVPGYLDSERAARRAEELKSAFARGVEYALEPGNGIKAVIIAGDLFETYNPEPGVRGFAVAQLERLSSASIPVLLIPGTHDSIGYPDSVYRTQTFPPSVYVLARPFRRPPLELRLEGQKFIFCWFTYEPAEKGTVGEYLRTLKNEMSRDVGGRRYLEAEVSRDAPGKGHREREVRVHASGEEYPRDEASRDALRCSPLQSEGPLGATGEKRTENGYRVFIAHASLKGSPAWEMRRKDLPVALEDLLSSGMHYVALGHYHNFWESGPGGTGVSGFAVGSSGSRETAAGGSPETGPAATKVVYPGTLEGKHFGENGQRYLVVAEFTGDEVRVNRIPFNKRVLEERTFSLDSEAVSSEEELVRRIASLGREDLLLRLTLTGSPEFPVRTEFLKEALSHRFFHIEVEDSTSVLSTISVDAVSQERTIRGMFVKKLKEAALSAPEKDRALYELAIKEGLSAFGGGK